MSSSVGTTNRFSFTGLMYQQFISHVTQAGIRRGQAWMHALNDVNPTLYKEISNTEADCFYDDRKIDAFKIAVFGKEE